MADQLQLRGGTTSEHSTFTGALREITVDTDKDTVVVHDGSTAGGHPLLKQDLSNLPAGTIDNADINASAAISLSKLATGALPTAITVASANIVDGTIVNADVNASAAIAGTKISPDFGSQTVQTTGVISHALGTAGAPTVTFTGDTNTGIYSPGADQVAISTNGTGRLFVDANGRLLAGTSSSSSYARAVFQGNSFGAGQPCDVYLQRDTAGTGLSAGTRIANLIYADNAGNQFANIFVDTDASTSSGDYPGRIVFATTADGASSPTERLRITSDGKVGVGTSSPSEALTVAGNIRANNTNARIGAYGANGSSPGLVLGNSAGTSHYIIYETVDGSGNRGSLNFFDNVASSNRLTIDTSGNVGVGTTSPSATLDVSGDIKASGTIGINGAAAQAPLDAISNASGYGIVLRGRSSDNEGRLRFTSNNYASIYSELVSTSSALAFNVNGSERLRIDSSGRVGIGTSSPNELLEVRGTQDQGIRLTSTAGSGEGANLQWYSEQTGDNKITAEIESDGSGTGGNLFFKTRSTAGVLTDRLLIDNAGRVGIGTTSPNANLEVNVSGNNAQARVTSTHEAALWLVNGGGSEVNVINSGGSGNLSLRVGNSERARLDSSGRLLVGTSSARGNFFNSTVSAALQIEGTSSSTSNISVVANQSGAGPLLTLASSGGSTVGSTTAVSNNNTLGQVSFQGSDGTEFVEAASIYAQVDGTPGANDMPGRLVFSTTADGASSPTERMRINSNGEITNKSSNIGSAVGNGFTLGPSNDGYFIVTRTSNSCLYINRETTDGTLVEFRQDNTTEGTISVSGTTVSYNGAHLSRWSQLPSGAERTDILRGSVLANIDEMCEWKDEENEQLNRMKVSDVEGDKKVAGVFQAWDDDDDTYTNDFYCAMTGDFIIRIAAGVTVENGDLLMSAGDGTAKPQDDDIIRSKTIAKVTSTNVSCTYEDGSYCVPCVLMAC